jgi:hypothetical protein
MAFSKGKYAAHTRIVGWVFFIAVWIISSCGVKKTIPKGEFLLKRNHVLLIREKATGNEVKIKSSDLTAQILHRSNKRVFFDKVPIYLWLYALGTSHTNPEVNESST